MRSLPNSLGAVVPSGRTVRASLLLTAAMGIAGSSVVVAKIIAADFPIFLANELRFLIASAILLPLLFVRGDGWPSVTTRERRILVAQALTGVFLFNVCLFYGVRLTTAAEAGIVTSTTPIVVAVIGVVFLDEAATTRTVLGVCLAVLGLLSLEVLGTGAIGNGPRSVVGNGLILVAVFGEALFTTLGKAVSEQISPLEITTAVTVLGSLLFLPFAVYQSLAFDVTAVPASDWISVVYYGVVVTVVAFVLWFRGVSMVPASTAATFTGVLPVSAVVLSYALLGEQFLWSHVVGMCCVLAGIGFSAQRMARVTGTDEEVADAP
jgi:drug/metabolite transporter (DMT)-like permease